jgi:hypothetical protein
MRETLRMNVLMHLIAAGMHQWSLFVQSLTLLLGLMIKTDQFTEILGEPGGQGRAALGGILVFFHFFVAFTPMLDQIAHTIYIRYVASRRDGVLASSCCSVSNMEEGDACIIAETGAPPSNKFESHYQLPVYPQDQSRLPVYSQADPQNVEISGLQVEETRGTGLAVGDPAVQYYNHGGQDVTAHTKQYPNTRNSLAGGEVHFDNSPWYKNMGVVFFVVRICAWKKYTLFDNAPWYNHVHSLSFKVWMLPVCMYVCMYF